MRARFVAAFCCATLSAWPAHAFLSDSEARKQIAELAKTVEALSQRIDALGKNQLDFANQSEALRAELARLNGQIELLTHSLDAAHKRQQDFYVDLDARLRKLEAAAAAAESTAQISPPATPPTNPQQEMRDYEAALGLFRERKFKEAQAAFAAFIAAYPRSTLLPNAHYWLGSSHYQQNGFLQAAAAFGKLAADWPNDARAPEALLQQADALVRAKDAPGALKALNQLIEKYPAAPEAQTARARLKALAPQRQR